MANLKNIRIERDLSNIVIEEGKPKAIRIDWDNDRHQRIAITGFDSESVLVAFRRALTIIDAEIKNETI